MKKCEKLLRMRNRGSLEFVQGGSQFIHSLNFTSDILMRSTITPQQVFIDGMRPLALTKTASFTMLNVGSVHFPTGGAKAFKFTVTGKNASSSVYSLALDAIQLQ